MTKIKVFLVIYVVILVNQKFEINKNCKII